MKTNKIIAAALLPLMFACTKENIGQTQVENGKYDVTISVSPDETKAYMDETHGLLWQTGDYYAGIVKDNKNLKSNSLSNVYPYPNVKGNPTNQASFSWSSVELGDYKFYYPYDSASDSENSSYEADCSSRTPSLSRSSSSSCFPLSVSSSKRSISSCDQFFASVSPPFFFFISSISSMSCSFVKSDKDLTP